MISRIEGPVHFADSVVFLKSVKMPLGTLTNDSVGEDAGIAASKLEHQHIVTISQPAGQDCAAQSGIVHVAHGAGELVACYVACTQAPPAIHSVSIQVYKSTNGGGNTSLLNAAATITSANTAKVPAEATVASANTYAAGDVLIVEITPTAGATDPHAEGVAVTLVLREAAQ